MNIIKKQIWKKIKGFPKYEISNTGEVRSFYFGKSTKLAQRKTSAGYFGVTLCENKERKDSYIHKLVAEAFLSNLKNKTFVNHKDGNKNNNNVSNLEWCTPSENMQHAYDMNLRESQKGESHGRSKLTDSDILKIRSLYKNTKIKQKELAEMFSVCRETVGLIVLNKIWKHI